MNRAQHLDWCKDRALEYVSKGDLVEAYNSMVSDLQKHPETENHIGMELGMMLYMHGKLSTRDEMKKFIEGFN